MMIRILLADDQPQVRSALGLLLEHEPGLEVVGEASNGDELMALASAAHPDLVLLDWELPGLDAERLSLLQMHHPALLLVALSGRPEARQRAQDAGIDAFVSKGDPPEELLDTLHALKVEN
jgi:DNA-binding NarL/FixJ family response regulator